MLYRWSRRILETVTPCLPTSATLGNAVSPSRHTSRTDVAESDYDTFFVHFRSGGAFTGYWCLVLGRSQWLLGLWNRVWQGGKLGSIQGSN